MDSETEACEQLCLLDKLQSNDNNAENSRVMLTLDDDTQSSVIDDDDQHSSASTMTLRLFSPKLKVFAHVGGILPVQRKPLNNPVYDLFAPYDMHIMKNGHGHKFHTMDLRITLEIPSGYCGMVTPNIDCAAQFGMELCNPFVYENNRKPIIIHFRVRYNGYISKGDCIAHLTLLSTLNNAQIIQVDSIDKLSQPAK